MATMIGVFEATRVEQALSALRRNGFGEDTFRVIDGASQWAGDSRRANATEDADQTVDNVAAMDNPSGMPGGLAPIAAAGLGSSNLGQTPIAAGIALGGVGDNSLLDDALGGLGLNGDMMQAYRDNVKNGASLIVVNCEAARIPDAREAFQQAGATNIGEPAAR